MKNRYPVQSYIVSIHSIQSLYTISLENEVSRIDKNKSALASIIDFEGDEFDIINCYNFISCYICQATGGKDRGSCACTQRITCISSRIW